MIKGHCSSHCWPINWRHWLTRATRSRRPCGANTRPELCCSDFTSNSSDAWGLVAYREQCCVCRLRHIELLDAAHILPDRHPLGEPAITNGLGLCKIHHSAYDANIIGIDPDARVHVREDVLREVDGPMLKHGLQEVAGVRLVLPAKPELRPNRDFLAERFGRFEAA